MVALEKSSPQLEMTVRDIHFLLRSLVTSDFYDVALEDSHFIEFHKLQSAARRYFKGEIARIPRKKEKKIKIPPQFLMIFSYIAGLRTEIPDRIYGRVMMIISDSLCDNYQPKFNKEGGLIFTCEDFDVYRLVELILKEDFDGMFAKPEILHWQTIAKQKREDENANT
jgi:hypothetical protein